MDASVFDPIDRLRTIADVAVGDQKFTILRPNRRETRVPGLPQMRLLGSVPRRVVGVRR